MKQEQKNGLLHLRQANRYLQFQERADGFQPGCTVLPRKEKEK